LSDPELASLSFGLSAAGILTLLPLSPNVLCLGYDGDMYSVAHKDGWLNLRRERDVDAFNQHQFLNCRANIFAREAEHESYVREAFRRAASNRIAKRYVLHYAVLDRTDAQSKRYKVVETPDPMAGGRNAAYPSQISGSYFLAECNFMASSWQFLHKRYGYGLCAKISSIA
jgi:hypothetical protein